MCIRVYMYIDMTCVYTPPRRRLRIWGTLEVEQSSEDPALVGASSTTSMESRASAESQQGDIDTCIYIYIYIHTRVYICIYVYT